MLIICKYASIAEFCPIVAKNPPEQVINFNNAA